MFMFTEVPVPQTLSTKAENPYLDAVSTLAEKFAAGQPTAYNIEIAGKLDTGVNNALKVCARQLSEAGKANGVTVRKRVTAVLDEKGKVLTGDRAACSVTFWVGPRITRKGPVTRPVAPSAYVTAVPPAA